MKEIGEVRFARVQGLALRVALEHECSCIAISVVYVSLKLNTRAAEAPSRLPTLSP